jgi:hypothetical protein
MVPADFTNTLHLSRRHQPLLVNLDTYAEELTSLMTEDSHLFRVDL